MKTSKSDPLSGVKSEAIKVALIYFIFSVLWILFSDKLLEFWVNDSATIIKISMCKGWAFVFISACLIFILNYRLLVKIRKTEVRRRAEYDRYCELIETTADWLWELDTKANFTYVSPRVKSVLGYDPQELVGKSGYDLMPPEEAKKISAQFDAFVEKELPFNGLINVNLHKDGRRIVLESNGVPYYDEQGKFCGYRGADRDVTDRVNMDSLLMQAEKMMTVGTMAAGIAHEVNNPLGIILNSIQNVFRRISDDIDENKKIAKECEIDLDALRQYLTRRKVIEFLDNIKSAGERSSVILNNMLNFSHKSTQEKQNANLVFLMNETIKLLSMDYSYGDKYDFRQIKLIKEFDAEEIIADCVQTEIQQVFINIIQNSAQAMFASDEVSADKWIKINIKDSNEFVKIEIEDNGPGISNALKKKIFDPFFTTKQTGKGTGLGLSVSYFIIKENHKGEITVDSQMGRGTKFTINLPKK